MEIKFSTHRVAPEKRSAFTKKTPPLFYSPAFDLNFTERLLGRRQRSVLTRTTRRSLTVQQNRLRDLIRPRVIWKELKILRTDKTGVMVTGGVLLKSRKMAHALRGTVKVVCFIATVGRRIDREIESLISGGALAHGYVADALGSGAVESVANRFHADMAGEAARNAQSAGLRFSPGYCDWPLTEQHKLFSLLDHNSVGVELGDTALMVPRKSISGVFGIFENRNGMPEISNLNPCRRCGKKDCIARRVDSVPPSSGQ